MKHIRTGKIGEINETVIKKLGLSCQPGTPIFVGTTNIKHMKDTHPFEFDIYGDDVDKIVALPDYIGLNKDGSIEYVKDYITENNEYVKLAVRCTPSSQYFARSLYALNNKRVSDFIAKGALIKYTD